MNKNIFKIIKNEMAQYEEYGTRGKYLNIIFDYLKTVQPTSVESERVFSVAGQFCTKIRSRLNDDTLNCLCFLRAHFLNEKNNI